MLNAKWLWFGVMLSFVTVGLVRGQDETTSESPNGTSVSEKANQVLDRAKEESKKLAEKTGEIAEKVDQDERAQKVAAGILQPIYDLAESFSVPMFHGIAFALMVAGVVSFALQLVLGKLVVLSKLSFSITEILSDALALVISLIGLVLTTQAAAENSTFTTSAFAVISATVVGAVVGFVFYLWGQRQELAAVHGRRSRQNDDQ